jgi:A/G-specific adenine glycosylase
LDALRKSLLRWFDQERRDLPWRRTRDPYAIWVSEVMLQQTQVATVIPYWERFLARFPSVAELARAPLTDVLSSWRGLGYYSRARNLHRAAQEITELHGARLPANLEALRALPGFGRYTAGAVASMAFGLPAPLVDGNVARVLSRLFAIEGAPGDRTREAQLWSLAEALVPGERPGDLNQALMELGALVCGKDPSCLLCPVRGSCEALRHDRVSELPPPRTRAPRKRLVLGAVLFVRRRQVLLGRRGGKGLFGGLWEMPCVEGILSRQELQAQLSSALGIPLRLDERLTQVRRTLTHRDLTVAVYSGRGRGNPGPSSPYAELRWFRLSDIPALAMSTAMATALSAALGG